MRNFQDLTTESKKQMVQDYTKMDSEEVNFEIISLNEEEIQSVSSSVSSNVSNHVVDSDCEIVEVKYPDEAYMLCDTIGAKENWPSKMKALLWSQKMCLTTTDIRWPPLTLSMV